MGVHKEDWDYQRILWRPHPEGPIIDYWITVVVWGMACAMFQAVRAMFQCAIDGAQNYPNASEIRRTSFYADDMASGADTVAELNENYRQMNALHTQDGF